VASPSSLLQVRYQHEPHNVQVGLALSRYAKRSASMTPSKQPPTRHSTREVEPPQQRTKVDLPCPGPASPWTKPRRRVPGGGSGPCCASLAAVAGLPQPVPVLDPEIHPCLCCSSGAKSRIPQIERVRTDASSCDSSCPSHMTIKQCDTAPRHSSVTHLPR